jgi:hypothetical protein
MLTDWPHEAPSPVDSQPEMMTPSQVWEFPMTKNEQHRRLSIMQDRMLSTVEGDYIQMSRKRREEVTLYKDMAKQTLACLRHLVEETRCIQDEELRRRLQNSVDSDYLERIRQLQEQVDRPAIGDIVTVLSSRETREYCPELIGKTVEIVSDVHDQQPYQVEGSSSWLYRGDVEMQAAEKLWTGTEDTELKTTLQELDAALKGNIAPKEKNAKPAESKPLAIEDVTPMQRAKSILVDLFTGWGDEEEEEAD